MFNINSRTHSRIFALDQLIVMPGIIDIFVSLKLILIIRHLRLIDASPIYFLMCVVMKNTTIVTTDFYLYGVWCMVYIYILLVSIGMKLARCFGDIELRITTFMAGSQCRSGACICVLFICCDENGACYIFVVFVCVRKKNPAVKRFLKICMDFLEYMEDLISIKNWNIFFFVFFSDKHINDII